MMSAAELEAETQVIFNEAIAVVNTGVVGDLYQALAARLIERAYVLAVTDFAALSTLLSTMPTWRAARDSYDERTAMLGFGSAVIGTGEGGAP